MINEIGDALARQLEFEAIIELVGERVREIFDSHNMFVGLYDEAAGRISFPYEIDDGRADPDATRSRSGPGLTSHVIRDRRPLRLGTRADSDALGRVKTGTDGESWLGVPILSGDRVLGVLALESLEANAFDEADERLLATVAASMGVALENARLFDETKRLLAETDARAAELAVINEIGEALARQLDFQAIVELVGERIRILFDSRSMFIAMLRRVDRHDRLPVRDRGRPALPKRADRVRPGPDVPGDPHQAPAPARTNAESLPWAPSQRRRSHGRVPSTRDGPDARANAGLEAESWLACRS